MLGDRTPVERRRACRCCRASSARRSIGCSGGGGTLGYLDYSHPIFDEFKDPRNGNFSTVRFFQIPRPHAGRDRQGAGAIRRWRARRWWSGRSGSGRVIAFTSTLDNTLERLSERAPVPAARARDRRATSRSIRSRRPGTRSGRMLDISVPIAAIVREGAAGDTPGRDAQGERRRDVAVGRAGDARRGRAQAVELAEQGFYSVRLQGVGDRRPFQVAVNLDPAESDLSALPPAEFVATATGRAAVTPTGAVAREPGADPGRHREEAVDLVVPVRGRGGAAARRRPCWPIGCLNGLGSGCYRRVSTSEAAAGPHETN